MSQSIIIKGSNLSGQGVFANKSFRKGETILRWHPKKLSLGQANSLPKDQQHYMNVIDGTYLYMQPPERYVNHSCDPNSEPSGMSDIAIRDIAKGEEITSDYGDTSMFPFTCHCGSKNCRHLIT